VAAVPSIWQCVWTEDWNPGMVLAHQEFLRTIIGCCPEVAQQELSAFGTDLCETIRSLQNLHLYA
jgi:hypothetical protein